MSKGNEIDALIIRQSRKKKKWIERETQWDYVLSDKIYVSNVSI